MSNMNEGRSGAGRQKLKGKDEGNTGTGGTECEWGGAGRREERAVGVEAGRRAAGVGIGAGSRVADTAGAAGGDDRGRAGRRKAGRESTGTSSDNTNTEEGHQVNSHQDATNGGAGSKGGTEGRVGAESKSGRLRRRRALVGDFSEEEEGETTNPQARQPTPMEVKAPYHELDIDMQLEDVSPKHGGNSLLLSISNDEFTAAPNQAATSRLDNINLVETTPTTKETTIDTHSAKRRRSEAGRHTTISDSTKSHNMKTKEAIPIIDIVSHMWLGFPIHEAMALHRGAEIISEHCTNEEFAKIGTPTREILDFRTLRRAFPRIPQTYYPSKRPDAIPGHHLHFTQIPRQENIDPTTGLSEGFYITIRFDHGFKGVSRHEARSACLERLQQMDIPLGNTYSNPLDIGINAVIKNWAGFIKVHLLHPKRDGLAFFRGSRTFVMEMEDEEKVIGKVEKGYELVTKASNHCLHPKGETLQYEHAFNIFEKLVHENYYIGKQHEFMGLTKSEIDKNYAFLTLTTEEARDNVLNHRLAYNQEKLKVSITRDRGVGNPSKLRISTTLIANNLPQRETQTTISRVIKQIFGADNIVGISFGNNNQPHIDKQAGWCHIQ